MNYRYGFLLLITCVFNESPAEVIEIGPEDDNLEATIDGMQAGDVLLLRGGDYVVTSRFDVDLSCTAMLPCRIQAKSGHTPHVTRLDQSQNIIDIDLGEYITFEGIEFSGGSRGIRISDGRYLTFKNNHIHDTGDAAITANDLGRSYSNLTFIQNHIHDTSGTGEGFYLGCNNNGCQVSDSLIIGNYIHHTNGPSVSQGDGIEIKEGSYGNVVSDNVIHDTNYPCVLTYGTVGNGPANIIERNVMWGCGDHGIQSAADTIIRNNIILGSAVDGIRNQPHQNASPENLQIINNTIINASGNALRLNGVIGTVIVANNALYAENGNAIQAAGNLNDLTVLNNVGEGSLSGVGVGFTAGDINTDFIDASYSNQLPQNVFPATSSALLGQASLDWIPINDFNFTPRSGSQDVGAYVYRISGNPGWILDSALKPLDEIFIDGFE